MTDFVFDVRAHFDTTHFLFSGGDEGLYVYVKLVPKDGFHLVKVVDGVDLLWESKGESLEYVTVHKLGDLPVFLLLKLSDAAFYFEYKDLSWHAISEAVYKDRLRLDLHGHHFDDFTFDLSKADAKNLSVTSVDDKPFLTTYLKPADKKVLVGVVDGGNVLWKAEKGGDKALSVSLHELNGVQILLRLTLVVSGLLVQKFFEKVGGSWAPTTLKNYFEKRAPKDAHPTVLDLSAKEHPGVFFVGGLCLGLPYDVLYSSILNKLVKVVDGSQVLWEAKEGEYVVYAAFDHLKKHLHLTVLSDSGPKELYFEKKDDNWDGVHNSFPDELKVLTH